MRQLWIQAMRSDSAGLDIYTEHHAGKTALHKYDSYINFWRKNPGQSGLEPIVRDLLSESMVQHFDKLARNAFLALPFRSVAMRSVTGSNPDFSTIDPTADLYDFWWADNAQLRAMTMNLPGFDGRPGSIIAVTTPGAMYHARKDPNFISLMKYSDYGIQQIVNGEVGSLFDVRYVTTPSQILWNCGKVTKQVAVKAPVYSGDGGHSWVPYTDGQV
jgi:N4-gp56 family major capsid protein